MCSRKEILRCLLELNHKIHKGQEDKGLWRGDEMRFVAYSDDSGSSDRRYRCIAVVSASQRIAQDLQLSLGHCLSAKQIGELKFEQVRGHAPKIQAASFFLQQAVDLCSRGSLRMDVLLWDNQDSRHSVIGRDDDANIARMYYKVLSHIARQWKTHQWRLFPDDQSGVDWQNLREFLNRSRLLKWEPGVLRLFVRSNPYLDFHPIVPQDSVKHELIQLADLFGGLSRFSREKGKEYLAWLTSKEAEKQPGLFLFDSTGQSSDSNADKARFSLLREFDVLCKKCKLGVSIREKGYLWTPKPSSRINFWSYVPHHEDDKAPTRP